MKRIKIDRWKNKVRLPDGEVQDVEESLLVMINALINSRDPQKLPRGIDQFRLFSKVSKAFEKADKSGTLELEDATYSFLKKMIEEDIPSQWGANTKYAKAIEAFFDAEKQTEADEKEVEKEVT